MKFQFLFLDFYLFIAKILSSVWTRIIPPTRVIIKKDNIYDSYSTNHANTNIVLGLPVLYGIITTENMTISDNNETYCLDRKTKCIYSCGQLFI